MIFLYPFGKVQVFFSPTILVIAAFKNVSDFKATLENLILLVKAFS
jgi:hypothetical protein